MANPLVSIIIRCHNEEEHIGRLLAGIFEQSLRNIEVIVVDSGSTDGTLAIASQFPVIICSIRSEEFSFGRALNIGCTAATGEYFIFASAHVYPISRRWLESLIMPFSDPNVALVYGKQCGDASTIYSEHQIFSKWFPEKSVPIQKSPFCNNANAAIRSSLWEETRYDEDLTGLEDLHWAKRIISKGYYLAYTAEAEIIHVHNETYSEIFNRYYREAIAMHRIFPEQKLSFVGCLWLWFLNTFSDYVHGFREKKLKGNWIKIPQFRLMQFYGTYKGYALRHPVTSALRERFYYPTRLTHSNSSQNTDFMATADQIDYSQSAFEKKHEQHD